MAREHLPIRIPGGPRLQSGIPKRAPRSSPLRARGLLLRGVVVATYVVDDADHPGADGRNANGPRSVYCDVISYSHISGMRWRMISQCLVLQDRGGVHDGGVWKPRAATKDITGGPMDPNRGSNPANWDGDHVLVGFVDDSLNVPVILGGVPHPNADTGATDSQTRRRLQLRVVDGDPRFIKHHGTHFGVDDEGNWILDSRFAHDGELEEDGAESAPATDGKGGQTAKLPLDAAHSTSLYDMTDPENPVQKVRIGLTKNVWDLEFVDSGLQIYVDDDNGLIELGTQGAGDELVLESKALSEHGDIRGKITNLSNEVEKLRMAVNMYFVPLIPNPGQPIGQCIPTELAANVGGSAQNVILAEEAKLGAPPVSTDASVGSYNPLLLSDGGSASNTNSDRVTTDQ